MAVYVPLNVQNLEDLQEIMEKDRSPAGGANTQVYISTEDLPQIFESPDTASISSAILSSGATLTKPSSSSESPKEEDPGYITNTSDDEAKDANTEKLEEGSEMLGGTDAEVQETVDQILEDADLSEKPENMTPEEYEEAKAQAILAWVEENIADKKDEGADDWQDAGETLEKGTGDCEDKAISIAEMLEAAGCDSSDVAVVVSADGSHAYVAVEIGGKVYTLDNGEFTETGYASLEEYLNSGEVGAWFTVDAQGINNESMEIDTAGADEVGAPVVGGVAEEIDRAFGHYAKKLSDLEKSVSPDQFYTEDGLIDAEALEKLFQEMMAYIYILEMLAILSDAYGKRVANAAEVKGTSVSSLVGQILDTSAGNFNAFIEDLFRTRLEKIQSDYQKEYNAADKQCDGFWEKVGDWFSGGENSQDVVRARIRASERFEKKINKLIETMEKVLGSLSPQTKAAANKMGSLVVKRPNGYMDLDIQGFLEIRNGIAQAHDISQFYFEVALARIERLSIANQITHGFRNISTRGILLKLTGAVKQHVLGLLDQTTNLYLVKKQVYNQINYDKLQLRKLEKQQGWNIVSMVFTLGAIVASIVAMCFTAGSTGFIAAALIGVACAVVSSAAKYVGAYIADKTVSDKFRPLENFDILNNLCASYRESGDEVIDHLADLSKQERALFNKFGSHMLTGTGDGYKAIDYNTFVAVTDKWENILMIRDGLIDVALAQAQRVLQAAKLSYGFDVGFGMKQVAESFSQSEQSLKELGIEGIKYTLNDMKWAWNMERSQEMAMDNAARNFWIGMGCAVVGGLLFSAVGGSFVYFGMGFAVLSALGSSIAEMVNASTSMDAYYNREKEIRALLEAMVKDVCENEYEQMENEYLIQLLEETKVSIGAGQQGLSSSRVVAIQRSLGILESIRSMVIDLESRRYYAVRDQVYSDEGVSGPQSGVEEKVQAHSSKGLSKKISYVLSSAREAIEVSNRAAKAKEAYRHASINFGINLGIAVLTCAVGGGMAAAGAVAGMTLLKLCAPAMSLITGIYNTIYYYIRSEKGNGDLENDFESAQKLRKKQIGNTDLEASEKLNDQEEEILYEVGKELLSRHGLNSGALAVFRSRLSRLYKLKETLHAAMEAEIDRVLIALESIGASSGKKFKFLSKMGQANQVIAFAAIENILSSLRSMGDRNREMDQAKLMFWKSLVGSSLSAIQFVLSCVSTTRSEKAHQLKVQGVTPDAVGYDQQSELADLQDKSKFWSEVPLTLNIIRILNVFSGLITTAIYRAARDDEKGETPTQMEAPEQDSKGLANAMAALQTEGVESQLDVGQSSLDREVVIESADLMEAFMLSVGSFIQSGIDIFTSWMREKEQEKVLASLQNDRNKDQTPAKDKREENAAPVGLSSRIKKEEDLQDQLRRQLGTLRGRINLPPM